MGHRCHRGTWLRWGGFVYGGGDGDGPWGGGQVLRMLGGSSAPASGDGADGVSAAGEVAPFPPTPRYFRCRSHKQREITKFDSRQRQNPPANRAALPGDRGGGLARWWPRVCRRVQACGCAAPRGTAGPLDAFPKPGGFLVALQPSEPCQEPKVTGQSGDVPGWVSPSPSHAPSALGAGIPCSLLFTCHVMVWLPVKPVAPGRALPFPPALPYRRWWGGSARPRGPCQRDARRVPELDADPCCSAGCSLYP